ncbi:hypothetical protein D9758_018235 [Tetrapyrgos nigripes]|uniref:ribonuclease H n=1 Tax=Tetrapyrgos nigripes TaxID=182062 RepID=A0A8H5F6I9_9AGAR|nr:hypothetical protein D9758_018235 [Tetrapyrgos nigripes]
MSRAKELLDTLPSKWDPRKSQPEDHEGDSLEMNAPEDADNFDYHITTTGTLSDIFRVFTDQDWTPTNEVLAQQVKHDSNEHMIIIATDGSCVDNGQESAVARAGIYLGPENAGNRSIKLPKHVGDVPITQSNQAAELVVAKVAPELIQRMTPMTLETDSKYVISHLTSSLKKMEDTGYPNVNNADIIRAMVANYRRREGPTSIVWVKGHNGHPGNEAADALAGAATNKDREDAIALEIPPELKVTGVKLNALTQKLAYNAI